MTAGERSFKTPAGVWVIVGMAGIFVLGGLGISAFVVWKSIVRKQPVPLASAAVGEKVMPIASVSGLSEGEVGVEHPNPNPTIEDADIPPPVINNRAEEERMRREVLKRIDLMKALTEVDKDKLYAQVERARGFTEIAIIPFIQNRMVAGAAQVDGLIKRLKAPELQKLLADPTVALFMVGYADKKGDETKNFDISRSRAESVVKAVKERMDLVNVMHAVGMGGQDIFDPSDLEKKPGRRGVGGATVGVQEFRSSGSAESSPILFLQGRNHEKITALAQMLFLSANPLKYSSEPIL